jgi:protein-disulfide isomerase
MSSLREGVSDHQTNTGEIRQRPEIRIQEFPLSEMHPQAFMAAVATEAAAKQDKFWEMHDILFERQDQLDLESIVGYAALIGINEKTFIKDLEDENCQPKWKLILKAAFIAESMGPLLSLSTDNGLTAAGMNNIF